MVDKNSKLVGITSVSQCKKICNELHGRLPRVGYEILVRKGQTKETHTGRNHEYHLYLANEAGKYRVWTWINGTPANQVNRYRSPLGQGAERVS